MSVDKEVRHLDGNLYLVPRSLIVFSDNPDGNFTNPRHTMIAGRPQAKGLDPQSMKALKDSIQKNGMLYSPILQGTPNIGNTVLEVNSGERRIRCVDMLVKENAQCFDRVARKLVPASELYSAIRCEINTSGDLKEQYRIAYTTNNEAEGIGETGDVMLVKKLREKGFKDEEILEITSRSSTWLREAFQILDLDEETFLCFTDGLINRKVAMRLAEVKDVEKRKIQLYSLRKNAAEKVQILIEEVNKSLEEAILERDLAEASAADAEEIGDHKRKQMADKKFKRAAAKLNKKKDKLGEVIDKKVTATKKDWDTIIGSGDGGRVLTIAKVEKYWLPELEKLIENNGSNENGPVCDVNDAILLKLSITMGWQKNEYDVTAILREHRNFKKNENS